MSGDNFLGLFIEEARELLQALETGLMELEARQGDRAHLDRTFRAAHTLKGGAGMVGLPTIAAFTHGVEAVLDAIRSGRLAVGREAISALLAARDHLAAAVEAAAEGRTLEPPASLSNRLADLLQPASSPAADASPAEVPAATADSPAEVRAYRVALNPRPDLLRKGIDPLGILDELRELGEARVTADAGRVPPLEGLDPLDCHLSWTIELRTADPAGLDEAFLFLDDRSQVAIEPIAAPAAVAPELPAPPPGATAPLPGARVRVDAGLLDELVGTAGELAVLIESVQGLSTVEAAAPWAGMLEALERVGRRLRDSTLELRMVPVEELFVRFPRVIRDLAGRAGKQIALTLEGEETRIDRAIVERLVDPMIHLLRNAVDHGLEAADERRAAGKSPTGRLRIGAGHEGDRVAIRVEDDGRGLDRARIARKAIGLGLLPPETPPEDPRVASVIFEPGFSTRDQAGELSGRGVGLDVVLDAIRALRGTVSLRSAEGRGTTFTIRLPLTLAMIDGLLVEADAGRYVVPMGQVEECVALDDDGAVTTMGRHAAIVRGELVPTVSLRGSLGGRGAPSGRQELLLTRHAEQRVGVAVDRLLGRVQAVIQPLDPGLARLRRFSGATILADGSICLILDLATLVADAGAADARATAAALPRTD